MLSQNSYKTLEPTLVIVEYALADFRCAKMFDYDQAEITELEILIANFAAINRNLLLALADLDSNGRRKSIKRAS